MYPFERFTERTKTVLMLAQEEAERAGHSYIGTEHLLLGLLREGDGLAAKVLTGLGVEIIKVRSAIESVLGRNERLIIQQIIPTSRVKNVIEISFEEARRLGRNYVGTEHLLLALLIEGEGIAAHVLEDFGAGLEKVRAEIDRQLSESVVDEGMPSGPAPRPLERVGVLVARLYATSPTGSALDALDAAVTEAQERGADGLTTADLLLGLLRLHDDPAGTLLADHGIDRDRVLRLIADTSARDTEN